MTQITLTEDLLGQLKSLNISFYPRVRAGATISNHSLDFEPGSQHPASAFMAIGAFSYCLSAFRPFESIGRYCSIGTNVAVYGDKHPTDWVSSSPMFYREARFKRLTGQDAIHDMPEFDSRPTEISIGNDVWIGDNFTLRDGIAIGDGAVIAANSVVTRDVLPYEIVGGAPAKKIRDRFPKKVVDKLLGSHWWDYHAKDLQHLSMNAPLQFIDELENEIAAGKITKLPFQGYTLDRQGQLVECPQP